MLITAPICRPQDIKPLAQAGADEFYCGVITPEWKRFGGAYGNIRPDAQENLDGFAAFKAALAQAKGCGRPLYLCVNNRCKKGLNQDWLPVMLGDMACAAKMGVQGFIVSDPILIPHVRGLGRGLKIIISTMAGCFNAQTLKFFARLGADRVVLDRQLTREEIAGLALKARAAGLELEAFIMNISCLYVNAFCTMHYWRFHLPWESRTPAGPNVRLPHWAPCRQERTIEILERSAQGWSPAEAPADWTEPERRNLYCAACSMGDLKKCGISSVKIIGRGFPPEGLLADVRFIRGLLDLLDETDGRADGIMAAARRLRRRLYGTDCHPTQCWHSDLLRERRSC